MEQQKTEVITEIKDDTKTKRMPLFKVLIHNDDVTPADYVVLVLMKVFGFPQVKAKEIMLEAHNTGCALCGVFTYEEAELKRDQLQALRITATIEPN